MNWTNEKPQQIQVGQPANWTGNKPQSLQVGRLAVYDDFNRADTTEPDLGTPVIGGRWIIGGIGARVPGTRGCIRSGRATTTVVGSAGTWFAITPYALGGMVTQLLMRGIWLPSGGSGAEGLLACGCGPSIEPYIVKDCVHLRFSRSSVSIDRIKNDVFTPYATESINPALPLNTPHLFVAKIDPDLGRVTIWVNGELQLTYQNSAIAEVCGPYAFWESTYSDGNSTAEAAIKEVSAYARWGWQNAPA